MSKLARAVDQAVASVNAAALRNPEPIAPAEPLHPEGTPEYEAYAKALREALADPAAWNFLP